MGLVLSFVDARAARVKEKLCALATSRCRGMVETAGGLIDARRIFCREAVAVLIDRYGYQTRIGYSEITDVSPVPAAAGVIALADWQVAERPERDAAIILPFPTDRS